MELAVCELGDRNSPESLLFIHGTGETGGSWEGTARNLLGSLPKLRVVTYDRRGWGRSGAPEPYSSTTVPEQAYDAIRLIDELGIESAWLCGDGLGAVVALDVLVREGERVSGVVAIEPPLLAFSTAATEGLSGDVKAVSDAAEGAGLPAAARLFDQGALPYMAPGSGRIAERRSPTGSAPALDRPVTLFAEAGAVPSWEIPFHALASIAAPVTVVTGTDSPEVLKQSAASIAPRIAGAQVAELQGDPRSEPQLSAFLTEALFG